MAGEFSLHLWEIICYIVILIVGISGNTVVCLVILRSGTAHRKFYHVPFNVYLMSLAIVDLALAVLCLPSYVLSTSWYDGHPTGKSGTILCQTITGYILCFWLAGTSVYLLVIISFERHSAICKPLQAVTRTTSTGTFVYIAAAWIMGLLIQLPSALRIQTVQPLNNASATVGNHCAYHWHHEHDRQVTYAVLLFLQYVVPASIFLFNFYRIQKSLSKLAASLERSFPDPKQRVNVVDEKRKTVKIVFIASAAFFICWTPNNTMFFLFQYGPAISLTVHYDAWYYQAGIVLAFSSSCINPILYALHSKQFRSHCRKVFAKMFKLKTSGNFGIYLEGEHYRRI